MAMTNEQENKIEKLLKTELHKQYLRGIRVGIQTCSKVCLEKLNDNSKSLMKRINDIKKYCSVAIQTDFLSKGIDDAHLDKNEFEIREVVTEESTKQNSDEID